MYYYYGKQERLSSFQRFHSTCINLHTAICPPFYHEHSALCSHILLSLDKLIVLRELSDRAGWGCVKYKHPFEYILKITAKKKNPDIITFKFGTGTGQDAEITEQLRFRIPNTSKATGAIKTQIMKHQDGITS